AGRVVRRPATAGGCGARARGRSAGPVDGRAVRCARSDHPQRIARRVSSHPTARPKERHHRDARYGRGIRAGGSHRCARRRPARRVRCPRRDCDVTRRARSPASRRGACDSTMMRALLQFWSAHRTELATLFAQHVVLVALSTVVAIAIGVPLGILAARRPRLASPLTALANIVQTVPSLAMFGFLLPVPVIGGVGARAALVVLILYGLLPIVRTTIAGIRGIDAAIVEAATAMGMT